MKLRWVIKRRSVTSDQIKRYANEHDIPMLLAKRELMNQSAPILQQLLDNSEWCDVPTEIIEYTKDDE